MNLASRLMDLACPRGIVFDDGFGKGVIPDDIADRFTREQVYVRGVSPDTPVTVHYLKNATVIEEVNKRPLNEPQWDTVSTTTTLAVMFHSDRYRLFLDAPPLDGKFQVVARHPTVASGRKHKSLWTTHDFTQHASLSTEAGRPYVVIDFDAVRVKLLDVGVKRPWTVHVAIQYRQA